MIGPMFAAWLLAHPPSQGITLVSSAPLMRLAPTPVKVITIVPTGGGWLVVSGSKTWASQGMMSCGTPDFPRTPLRVIVHEEGKPQLVISLNCPEEGK